MRSVGKLGVVMSLLWIVPGCGERGQGAVAADVAPADTAPPARKDGAVIFADRQERVTPFLMHDPHLDLFVRCQMKRDAAKRDGKPEVLCFDPTRRPAAAVTVLRVERTAGDLGGVLRYLSATDEGAHFVVEKTGTAHQLLDAAYAARRDGALRPHELRIISCHETAWKPVAEALQALFPGLRVEVSELTPPSAPPTPKAPATAPDAPAPAPDPVPAPAGEPSE